MRLPRVTPELIFIKTGYSTRIILSCQPYRLSGWHFKTLQPSLTYTITYHIVMLINKEALARAYY